MSRNRKVELINYIGLSGDQSQAGKKVNETAKCM